MPRLLTYKQSVPQAQALLYTCTRVSATQICAGQLDNLITCIGTAHQSSCPAQQHQGGSKSSPCRTDRTPQLYCKMAAFVDTVAALRAHLASVAHRINDRKQQKAQREGRPLRSAAAPPGAAFVAAELVKLLQEFPSGVSSAVMYTHVTERWGAQARCMRMVPSCLLFT